uniref:alpha-1,2-Mannosidase n=1 Tax=Macrostomum lignano TaxID=282301 RepID=A0A1I8F5N3_9PLAT
MFQHAYDNYMTHAYPGGRELMPVSCRGRYPAALNRPEATSTTALANYSLTLIDSLDTLLLLNEPEQFEYAVRLVVDNVRFNTLTWSCPCSRPTSGLLAACLAVTWGSLVLKHRFGRMSWYSDQLLFARNQHQDTCTACAGSMLLEFAALSRFSGNPRVRTPRQTRFGTLCGASEICTPTWLAPLLTFTTETGSGRRAESGLAIDSYYEYLFKAYVLLGEEVYLQTRFSKHSERVQNYLQLCRPPLHPTWSSAYNFMPGSVQRPTFTFTGLITHSSGLSSSESTVVLSIQSPRGDPHLPVRSTRGLSGGYAAISDVRTMEKSDQLDSFVLAETF